MMDFIKSIDWTLIGTTIAPVITIIGFVYTFFRNFKTDICDKMDKMESRIDTLEERMFWLATGKKLQDAILEERMKIESKKTI